MPNLSLRKLWRKKSVTISGKDPTYEVFYLGNVLTGWAKGDGCTDKPLATLWRNYCQSNKNDIIMKITICGSGLNAVTREHGLTEYWAHRITFCGHHPAYPKVFCWVYRHEGRKLKQEMRCHAVICNRSDIAVLMAKQLKDRLIMALQEFKREKVVRQNARLSLVNAIYDNASLPTRKVLLSTGSANYRPPLERSKSAPKLGSIEETVEEHEEFSPILEEGYSVSNYSRHFQTGHDSRILTTNNVSISVPIEKAPDRTGDESSNNVNIVLPMINVMSNSELDENNSPYSRSEDYKLIPVSSANKTPVIKRKFIRSITIDHVFDETRKESEDITMRIIDTQSLKLIDATSDNMKLDEANLEGSSLSTVPQTFEDDSISRMRGLNLTRQISLSMELRGPEDIESSLTSDQPESLGSNSCNSSCGEAESIDVRNFTMTEQTTRMGDGSFSSTELLDDKVEIQNNSDTSVENVAEETDNISEESGYAEEKEMPMCNNNISKAALDEGNELRELLTPT